eukprot:6213256-Pleurochrysis_carterae.AAC.1
MHSPPEKSQAQVHHLMQITPIWMRVQDLEPQTRNLIGWLSSRRRFHDTSRTVVIVERAMLGIGCLRHLSASNRAVLIADAQGTKHPISTKCLDTRFLAQGPKHPISSTRTLTPDF